MTVNRSKWMGGLNKPNTEYDVCCYRMMSQLADVNIQSSPGMFTYMMSPLVYKSTYFNLFVHWPSFLRTAGDNWWPVPYIAWFCTEILPTHAGSHSEPRTSIMPRARAFRTSPSSSLCVLANEPPLTVCRNKLSVWYCLKLSSTTPKPTHLSI